MKKLIILIAILIATTTYAKTNEIIPIWNNSINGGDIQDMQILKGGEEALLITGLATNSKFIIISTEDGSTIDEYEGSFAEYAKFEILPDSLRIVNVNNFNENTIEIRSIEDLKTIDSIRVRRPEGLLAYINNITVDPVRPIIYVNVTAVDTTNGRFKASGNVQAYNYDNLSFEKDYTEFIDDEYSALAVSNDGRYLAAINDGLRSYLKIWDLETNELIITEPLFDNISLDNCEAYDIIFPNNNRDIVYISGLFTQKVHENDKGGGLYSYSITNKMRELITPNEIYGAWELQFIDNEQRVLTYESFTLGVINISLNELEYYNTPQENIFSSTVRYNTSKDCFIGVSGKNTCKFEYDRKTNVNNEYEKEIIISPNPTSSLVNISTSCLEQIIDYSIYNMEGSLISQNIIENQESNITIDFTPYPSGTYFLSFQCNENMKMYKIVKAS